MEKRIITLSVILVILGILISQSIYTVHQTEVAIVLQLGEPVRDVEDPGLHFKLPFIQNVVYLDARILGYDATRASAYTSDNKNIVLDNFTRWCIKIKKPRTFGSAIGEVDAPVIAPVTAATADATGAHEVQGAGATDSAAAIGEATAEDAAAAGTVAEADTAAAEAAVTEEAAKDAAEGKSGTAKAAVREDSNPLKFYKTLRTPARAQERLGDIVNSELRVVIGRYSLTQVITTEREAIMQEVIKRANAASAEYGIEIVDVRIKRADLPEANQVAVFDRMRAERVRLATQYRSEGVEESTKIRSAADLEQTRLLSKARNEAQVIKGKGDSDAVRIFADALSTSPDFYEFSRSLEAYKNSLKRNTRLLIPLGSEFLKHFN